MTASHGQHPRGASFAPKRTSTLGSLNEATMSTRLHAER